MIFTYTFIFKAAQDLNFESCNQVPMKSESSHEIIGGPFTLRLFVIIVIVLYACT